MKHRSFIFIFLTILLVLSFVLRFYNLAGVPNGLSTDEADMGYNAYSIIQTGKDVYGRPYPIFFQALDDYKPGLPFYILIPAIKIFGLNDFSMRITQVIIGSFIPIIIFITSKLLYPKNKILPYITSVSVSLAPWSIAMSRSMWYVELMFLYILFITYFLYAIKYNFKFLILCAVILGSTLYVYYASILYVPFLLIAILLIYKRNILSNIKITAVSIIVFLFIASPAISHYMTPQSKTRLNAISILTPDITLPLSLSEITYDQKSNIPFAKLLHNRRLVYLNALTENYVKYFNLDYLFVNSAKIRYFYVNYAGLFYFVELPFFLYGLYRIIIRREASDLLILSLIIIGPIPAMFTQGGPFIHRALLMLISIQLISVVGISSFFRKWQHWKSPVIFLYAFSILFFLHQYYVHVPQEFSSKTDNGVWFPTVRDAIPVVNTYQDRYDKIIFTWLQPRLVPPVYFLFYNQIDPKNLQAKASGWTNEPPSYRQIYSQIGKMEFRPISWETDKDLKKTLLVGYPSEFPEDVNIVDRTFQPNGEVHFILVENR